MVWMRIPAWAALLAAAVHAAQLPPAALRARAAAQFASLPLAFEENRGQAGPHVRYLARAAGYTALLTGSGLELALPSGGRASMRLLHGRDAALAPETPLAGRGNYFVSREPRRWIAGAAHFARVRLPAVYPGIDLVHYGNGSQLEYDFEIAPGARPSRIRLQWEGARRPRLDAAGDLLIDTGGGLLRQNRPRAYQVIDGRRRAVAARYRIGPDQTVSFALGRYDRRFPLTIDPALSFSTYLGTAGQDFITDVTVDGAGNIYLTGNTTSLSFPTTAGALQTGRRGTFVAKMNSAGTALLYATYLAGSSGLESGFGIAVDPGGNAYIAGGTQSADFPLVNPYQNTKKGRSDFFVAKLNPTGSALLYSTYLGGNDGDTLDEYTDIGIAVDPAGSAYVAGQKCVPADYPITPGAFQAAIAPNTCAGFVTKFTPAGNALAYSTYLGGAAGFSDIDEVAVDGAGHAYVAGNTTATDFPVTAGALQTAKRGPAGFPDAFVAKLNPSGAGLAWSTYLGGDEFDAATTVFADDAGRVYVGGETRSSNFPVTPGAYDAALSPGNADAFLAKLNSKGTALIYSTYLGGGDYDYAISVWANAEGNAYVGGYTTSTGFPTSPTAYDSTYNGGGDAFLAIFDRLGAGLSYSTYLGGEQGDTPARLAGDAGGNVTLAGTTQGGFPATFGVFQPSEPGQGDGFVARFTASDLPVCTGGASANTAVFPAAGGVGILGLGATGGCQWAAFASNRGVAALSAAAAGAGDAAIGFTLTPNPNAAPRAASFTVARQVVNVIQLGQDSAPPFGDVPVSHPFLPHIAMLKLRGITSGCTAVNFCPADTVTRGQMAVFLVRSLMGDAFPFPQTPYFTDVPAAHPYFRYIQMLRQLGITTGCTAATYCPDDPVTRGQMAVFLIRSIAGETFDFSAAPFFNDAPAAHPYFRYIQGMRRFGVTTGCTATAYCPDTPVPREQMAAFLIRAFETPR